MSKDPGVVIVITNNSTNDVYVCDIETDEQSAQEFCAEHSTPDVPVTYQPADE